MVKHIVDLDVIAIKETKYGTKEAAKFSGNTQIKEIINWASELGVEMNITLLLNQGE